MKLNIEREVLLEPLQTVIGVVERRHTLPILANVLLSVEEARLSITATDTEIELISSATMAEPLAKPMQITLPGRKLLDIFRTLPEGATIDLQQDPSKERVIMRSGRSRFILSTFPAESFPRFKAATPILTQSITQRDLSLLLQRSQFAMAQQDVRYYLNGMLLDVKDNKIRTVATDGHRFVMNGKSMDTDDKNAQMILPRKSVLELLRLLKQDDAELTMDIGQNHVSIRSPAFTFTSRLIDGRYPDYERVLPQSKGGSFIVNREALKEALQRVSILSNEQFRTVRLEVRSGFLHVLANNPEQEEAEEVLSVDYTGEELDIAFNVSYLMDVLNTVTTENIRLTFIDANSRMLIEEADGTTESMFLIMPLQL